jgi:hypothetical protein
MPFIGVPQRYLTIRTPFDGLVVDKEPFQIQKQAVVIGKQMSRQIVVLFLLLLRDHVALQIVFPERFR